MSHSRIGFPARLVGIATAMLAAAVMLSIPLDLNRISAADDQLPPVYLNHIFIVLDEETYAALSSSDFIRNEFAGFEQRTTEAGSGESWSGTYLYGERTYIELFQAAEGGWFERWNSGIAFCVETPGALESVAQALDDNLDSAEVSYYPRTMITEDKGEVPWFQVAQPLYEDGEAQHGLSTWVMEYHPGFLNTMAPETYPAPGDITRGQYLKRFFIADRYLKDIVAVKIALHPQRYESFLQELQAFAWKIDYVGDEAVCEGPEITITVGKKAATGGPLVTEIEFSLSREKEGRKVYTFGDGATLEFGEGLSAVLRFK
jgi:hypothetical protein